MSSDLSVAYLEDQDFDEAGNFINQQLKGRPVMVMIQASWCGACTSAKPQFQAFADNVAGDVVAATIQIDGDRDSERRLAGRLSTVYPEKLAGVPSYMLITANGRRLAYNGPRDPESIANFVRNN